jgi:hypothetical protein
MMAAFGSTNEHRNANMNPAYSRKKILAAVGVAVFVAGWGLLPITGTAARAELARHSTAGDMFYNYYVPPVGPGSVGAELYVCPRPTPPMVGHTYVTYQPLMPHEFLYPHHRHYKTYHVDAPPTRTSVHWGHGWNPLNGILEPPKTAHKCL